MPIFINKNNISFSKYTNQVCTTMQTYIVCTNAYIYM